MSRFRNFAFAAWALLTAANISLAVAQTDDTVTRSSSPQGFQVQSGTGGATASGNVGGRSSNASMVSDTSANSPGPGMTGGKTSVQIQGATRINATATSTNAVAVGQGNKAGNELGAIGK